MVAKTFGGLEEVLADELKALGAENVKAGLRAVTFTGDKGLLYKANFCLRTALRVLKPIGEFNVENREDLYEGAKKIDWTQFLSFGKSFAINSTGGNEELVNSMFISMKVKDAIVDQFREKFDRRPSVNVDNPDIRIQVHIQGNLCTIALDSSGESLHKRGYRVGQTEAPINEVLAAGMIKLSGWNADSDFIDPMCGSGTIPIEAALIAYNIPPGMYREHFGFEDWPDFDADLFEEIYNADYEREFEHQIFASDQSKRAINITQANVKNAGLKGKISIRERDFKDLRPYDEKGIIMINPPYGERLKPADLSATYQMIGERLKHVWSGYTAWIITSAKENFYNIGLRPSAKIPLMNGPIECSFQKFEMYAGSKKSNSES